jgi:hypothetical protein
MINKASNKKEPDDHAVCDCIAHLVIKDKNTGKIIVNRRG